MFFCRVGKTARHIGQYPSWAYLDDILLAPCCWSKCTAKLFAAPWGKSQRLHMYMPASRQKPYSGPYVTRGMTPSGATTTREGHTTTGGMHTDGVGSLYCCAIRTALLTRNLGESRTALAHVVGSLFIKNLHCSSTLASHLKSSANPLYHDLRTFFASGYHSKRRPVALGDEA